MSSPASNSEHVHQDQSILQQIDRIQLSQRLKLEREQFFKREVEIAGDRAALALEWGHETEGAILDVRWAKLVQKWAERLPIVIFKGQLVVGTETKLFRGANPWVEFEAPNVVESMEKGRQMRTSAARVSECAEEDWEIVSDAVNFFLGKTPVDVMWKNLKLLYGDWPEELERARGILRHGRYNQSAPVPMWDTLLTKGLRGIIQEAQAGIDRVRRGQEAEVKKAWFWQAVIIVCEAVIHYAHRYSKLARDLAQDEQDPVRRKELEQVAELCERVPEHPARTLHEAVQSRIIWGVVMKWCNPNLVGDECGRMDQYLYPYLISDIHEGRLTIDQAADLIGTVLSNVSRRDGVRSKPVGQVQQGALVNNVTLGGVDKDGRDANNELTYLILHMVGLLKYAEPHYTFRMNDSTPQWILQKALDTNRKVGGGQPQFMSDNHIISYMLKQGENLEAARDWMGNG